MVTLTGTFTRLDGTPASGTVRVTPSRSPIMDPDGKIVISGPQVFPLDKDGKLTVQIPASNDPDLGPAFTYAIDVNLTHASWKISKVWIPHGSTVVDLSEISEYTPVPGVATRTVTIPADGTDGQVLVWDGAGFSWADQQIAPPVTAAELIAERLTFRSGDITVGIASDSTSAGTTGWVRLWEAHLAERYPHLRIEHHQWDDTTKNYLPPVVVQDGDGEPAFSGEILHDTFTRTTNLETPDQGGPWEVVQPTRWVLDGTTAKVGGTSGGAALNIDTGTRDFTSETILIVDSTGTGSQQTFAVDHGSSNGIQVGLVVGSSGGVTARLYRRLANSLENVAQVPLSQIGVPLSGPAPSPIVIEMTGEIQSQSVTISHGTQTWERTFTIPVATYEAMEPEFWLFPKTPTPGIGVSEVAVSVANRPATYQTLTVKSGTKSGGTLQYQLDHWDTMFGDDTAIPGTPDQVEEKAVLDTFTRTGPLDGSVTNTGETWVDSGGAWTVSAGSASNTAPGNTAWLPTHGAQAATWDLDVVTAALSPVETLRLGVECEYGTSTGLYITVNLSSTGDITARPYVQTPTGGYRQWENMGSLGLEKNSSVPQRLTVSVQREGLVVTVKAGTVTATETLTQAEADELGDHAIMRTTTTDASWFAVTQIEATYETITPGTPEIPASPLDVMIIGHGHNYGTRDGATFIGLLETFLDHMRDRRPSTLPLLSSQNPQFPPTANPGPHADRQRALRRYARQHQIAYVPVFEHFAAQPDGGRSWVRSDGVHPITPATPTPTAGVGSSEWGRVLADAVTD